MARQRKVKPPTWTPPVVEAPAEPPKRKSRGTAEPRRRGRREKPTYAKALQLVAEGRSEEALRELEAALKGAPDDALMLAEVGHLHRTAGRWHEAEVAYQKAIGLLEPLGESPPLTACVAGLAEAVGAQQRRVEAEDLLDVAWVMMLRDTDPFAEVSAASHPSQVFRAALKAAVTQLGPGRAHLFYRGVVRAAHGEPQLDSSFVADAETGHPVLEVSSRGPGLALRSQLTRAGLSSVVVVPWAEGHFYADRPPGAPYLELADLDWLQRLGALVAEKLEGADLAPSDEAWRSRWEKGSAHLEAGELREARLTLEAALNLAELWGHADSRRGVTLLSLGLLHHTRKRKGEALRLLREGLECCQGWPLEEAKALTALASLLGKGEEADALLDRALVLTLQTGTAEAPVREVPAAPDEAPPAAPVVLAAPILPWERGSWVAPAAEVPEMEPAAGVEPPAGPPAAALEEGEEPALFQAALAAAPLPPPAVTGARPAPETDVDLEFENAERAVEEAARQHGPADARYALALEALAALYRQRGRLKRAEYALQRAITVLEPAGLEHYQALASCLTQLAGVLEQQRRGSEGEEALDRAWVLLLRGDAREKRKALPEAPPEPVSDVLLNPAYNWVVQSITQDLRAERVLVMLASGVIVGRHGTDSVVSLRMLQEVALSGAPVLLGANPSPAQQQVLKAAHIRSMVCVPFWRDGEIGGVLYADVSRSERPFDRQDLKRLSELARDLEAGPDRRKVAERRAPLMRAAPAPSPAAYELPIPAVKPVRRSWARSRVTSFELATFARQFATSVSAGVTMSRALLVCRDPNTRLGEILGDVHDQVNAGQSLSAALASHSKVFGLDFVGMVQVAERTGRLAGLLTRLADDLETRERRRMKMRGALTYPAFLVGASALAIGTLLVAFVPMIRPTLASLRGQPPAITRVLLTASDAIRNPWLWVAAVGIPLLCWLGYRRFVTGERALRWEMTVAKGKFQLPLFGKLYQQATYAGFFNAMAVLLDTGVRLDKALELAGLPLGNMSLHTDLAHCRERLAGGEDFVRALDSLTTCPPQVRQILVAGHEAGRLPPMCVVIARTLDLELEIGVEIVNSLIEPFLLLGVGIITGFVVMAALAPTLALLNSF